MKPGSRPPRSAAEAALAETLAATHHLEASLSRLKADIDELPGRLQAAGEPIAKRLEEAAQKLRSEASELPNRATSSQAVSPPVPPQPARAAQPPRIPTPREKAERYTLGHILMMTAIGIVIGALIAAATNLRIPGISY